MRRSFVLVALPALNGCFYYTHRFDGFTGTRVELQCLDVALALTQDDRAPSPVIAYSFGNRCGNSTVVDLASVRVIGRDRAGHRSELHARDPNHELQPLRLDGWWSGEEHIAYVADDHDAQTDVCIEVGHIDRGEEHAQDRWICLGASEARSI